MFLVFGNGLCGAMVFHIPPKDRLHKISHFLHMLLKFLLLRLMDAVCITAMAFVA